MIDYRYQSISIGDLYRLISSVSIDFRYRVLSIDYAWYDRIKAGKEMKIHRTIWLQAFLSPPWANVTQCTNQSTVYYEWKHFCPKLKKIAAECTERKYDLYEEGLDRFRRSIKFSASTGKNYSESTGKCNSMFELFTSTGRDLDDSTITFSASMGLPMIDFHRLGPPNCYIFPYLMYFLMITQSVVLFRRGYAKRRNDSWYGAEYANVSLTQM